jgi:hypothetical protein
VSGYVRIHRTLLCHPAFRNEAEAMAFAWLVAKAAWQPTKQRYKGHDIILERGQLTVSIRDFADKMDRPKGWVERLFARLRAYGMIEQKNGTQVGTQVGTHGGTIGGTPAAVITICNYEEYQARGLGRETPPETPSETLAGQRPDTEQVREEVKKIDTPKPPEGGRRGKILLPDDRQLPSVADLPPKARACAEKWTPENYETHGEAFVSYWRSERKMKADWRGTWANRVVALHSQVMRDQKFGNSAPAAKSGVAVDWEARARFYDSVGRRDDADECRRKATPIGHLVTGISERLRA